MRLYNYPYIEQHEPIINYAFVVTCEAKDDIAGFLWCYVHEDDDTKWSCHALVAPKYQKRFFTRRLMNALFGVAWATGVDSLYSEASNTELLLRMGGHMTDDGAVINLPHKWG